jgi:hypothetical protein
MIVEVEGVDENDFRYDDVGEKVTVSHDDTPEFDAFMQNYKKIQDSLESFVCDQIQNPCVNESNHVFFFNRYLLIDGLLSQGPNSYLAMLTLTSRPL